jgi:hypothetical protein
MNRTVAVALTVAADLSIMVYALSIDGDLNNNVEVNMHGNGS